MTSPGPDPDDVARLYKQLFGDALVPDDLIAWYRDLTYRASVLEAVLKTAQIQRSQVVAHMHDSLGMANRKISATLGDVNPARVGQMIRKGRQHITPVNPRDYGGTK